MKKYTGSCQCKAINFTTTIDDQSLHYHVCHCSICRKISGGPLMSVPVGTQVAFNDWKNISVFASSDWANRGFCKKCGTAVYYRLKEPDAYYIPVWLFEQSQNFSFDLQIFTDHKPDSYTFANTTHMMSEADVLSQYENTT